MFKLAIRNLRRHKARSALTLGAIALGTVALILSGGFVEDIFIQLREATIHSQLGHLQVFKRGYLTQGRRAPFQFMIQDPDRMISDLRQMPEVIDVMPRVNFSGLLNNRRTSYPIIGEGVDAEKEMQLSKYIIIREGRHLSSKEPYGIMLGSGVASALNLRVGDDVTLLLNTSEGALNTLDLQIVGVFQTLSKDYDDRAVRIPVLAAWELLGTKSSHSLVVALKDSRATDEVAALVRDQLPAGEFEAKTWYQLSDFYQKTVDLYQRHFGVLRLIILGMVLLSVANSINMNIHERTGEFGTLMALGHHRRRVFALVMAESVVLGFVGGMIGILLGSGLALLISSIGIPMPPMPNTELAYIAYIRLVPAEVGLGFLVAMAASIFAAILPGIKVSRLPIVYALSKNI